MRTTKTHREAARRRPCAMRPRCCVLHYRHGACLAFGRGRWSGDSRGRALCWWAFLHFLVGFRSPISSMRACGLLLRRRSHLHVQATFNLFIGARLLSNVRAVIFHRMLRRGRIFCPAFIEAPTTGDLRPMFGQPGGENNRRGSPTKVALLFDGFGFALLLVDATGDFFGAPLLA